ncbi:hypothetical protein [Erythrobacter dokdonensis]|uniref:Uncharacterized protein n=1 Tax=Erythrobacter dokdonensis DSW-74 TaxID=1300349 RepID=A0A1A7BFR7_9SPHN|nr:hypothetical protein [Erythrobacter dokdonensis]OBV10591.1 hypothetical protein I603_1804 [Erythrobacter dokdonensis DSW-74]
MGKLAIGILTLLVGLVGGTLIGAPLIAGAMMGAGAGVGLSTGTCMTVQAAKELGYLTDEQVNEVMKRAAEDISGKPIAQGQQIAESAAACREVLENIKRAGEDS